MKIFFLKLELKLKIKIREKTNNRPKHILIYLLIVFLEHLDYASLYSLNMESSQSQIQDMEEHLSCEEESNEKRQF